MKVFYSDHFVLPLPEGHRFPMSKYSMLRERVERSDPDDLRAELLVPRRMTNEEILRSHTPSYLSKLEDGALSKQEERRIGFPYSREMVERCRRTCGGTLGAALAALEESTTSGPGAFGPGAFGPGACGWSVAVNLAGGTHHAFADRGEGFCVFNDTVIAARALQAEGLVERVLVVDTDVHQGNGTASILSGDETVFTFSIHGAKNFPFHKETSDLDVALDDGTADEEYLDSLGWGLAKSLDSTNADLAVFLAGADPFEGDRLGRMAVTKDGLKGRDRMVLDALREREIPTVVTMAGGYAKEVEDTVDVHFETVSYAAALHARGNAEDHARGGDRARES